ncbi:AAA family ATPase [Sinorhizobium fredii]|uniref:AAA family ATPase n=1 Tax=Rhizobium fredii TaxID=380 RepID=UPI0018658A29|nr:AAA family ATPase [Sinorhizobium fredii]
MLLKLAIDAQLPLVAVTTRDVMNLPDVLYEITKKKPAAYMPNTAVEKGKLYTLAPTPKMELPLTKIYEQMVKHESTLLLINPAKVVEPMFDAGEVPVPRKFVMKFLMAIVDDAKKAEELMRGLGGCTIKEAAELARLTMARDNSLTAQGLMETRKASFQAARGLTQVDTRQDYYEPPPELKEWVIRERAFFLTETDHRLVPRGLLLDGPPGVGKTAAAKWIADQFAVPLYRVDVGGTKNMYVGQSEANMLTNLARLDHEEPCIALLDEIEKVFAITMHDSSGTTSTMLSQLLWWLAERRSRVLVVMTTNNAKALPKELYREGRVDQVMWFNGLDKSQAPAFVKAMVASFKQSWSEAEIKNAVTAAFSTSKIDGDPPTVSQAALTKVVHTRLKMQLIANSG